MINKVGVVIVAEDPRGAYRFLLRKNSPFNGSPEEWNFVYGHIEDGETALDCALREAYEELSLRLESVTPVEYSISRKFPDNKYIHIEYFYALLKSMTQAIQLNNESIGYQWATFEESQKLIIDAEQSGALEGVIRKVVRL